MSKANNGDDSNMSKHPNSPFRGRGGERSVEPGDVVSKETPLLHYQWGGQCDGWNLVDEKGLSVKLERMPPNTSEKRHFHQQSQQFFFILKGTAVFEIDDARITVKANQGIHIRPMQTHRIINENDTDLEFILSAQPSTADDRINCE